MGRPLTLPRAAAGAPEADVGMEAARRALRAEGDVTAPGPLLVVELRPATAVVRLDGAPGDAAVVLRRYEGRRLVVVVRDAHRHEWQRASADALLKAAGGGIAVETGLAVWRPERASAYVATYGAGRVNLDAAAELIAA